MPGLCFPSTNTCQIFTQKIIDASGSASFVTQNECYSLAIITVKASYDSAASKGVRIRWLYSADGQDFDSPHDAEDAGNYEDLTFSAGSTRTRTCLIPLLQKFTKIEIINLDESYSVTVDVWRKLIG